MVKMVVDGLRFRSSSGRFLARLVPACLRSERPKKHAVSKIRYKEGCNFDLCRVNSSLLAPRPPRPDRPCRDNGQRTDQLLVGRRRERSYACCFLPGFSVPMKAMSTSTGVVLLKKKSSLG